MSTARVTNNSQAYRAGGFGRPLLSGRLALACALLCAGCGGPAGSAPATPTEGDRAQLYTYEMSSPALAGCGANRVLLQPQGRAIAVWSQPSPSIGEDTPRSILATDEVEIINLGARRNGSPRPFATYSPGLTLQPLTWAADGSALYAIWKQSTLVRVATDAASAIAIAELDNEWNRVRITAVQPGDAEALLTRATARMGQLSDPGSTGLLATLAGSDLRFALAPSLAGNAVLIEGDVRRETSFPALLLRDHRIVSEPRGLALYGIAAPGGELIADDIGYRRPIVDLASGRRVGSFGLSSIELAGPAARGLDALLRSLPRPYLLRDVSVSGTTLALLFGDLSGEAAIAVLRDGRAERVTICDFEQQRAAREMTDRGGPNPRREVVDFLDGRADTAGPGDDRAGRRVEEVDFRRVDSGTESFGTLFAARRNPQRRLVVYFHGGPAQSAIDGDLTEALRRLDLTDADLMVFEYSGSAARNAALFRALPEQGPFAIDRDIAAFGRWAEGRAYRQVHLIGASFGSLPVMAALAAPRLPVCSASLVAPALEWQDSTALAARRGGDRRGFIATRDAFARAAFGGDAGIDRLNAWLAGRRGSLGRPGVHLYFASRDILSARSQLPPEANRDDRVTVLNGSHVSMQQSPQVWSAIRRTITAPCSVRR